MRILLSICIVAGLALSGRAQESVITSANLGPKYLGVVAVSLDHGDFSRGFGFKVSNDGTNWSTVIQQAATVPHACYAPAVTHIGTNWIVSYDVYALDTAPSNVWAQMVSSDLVNWTGPTYFTNAALLPQSVVGGPRFYRDGSGVTYQFLTFWKTQPYNMWSFTLTNSADVNSWGNGAKFASAADDVSICVGDDGRYYLAGGTLTVDISTNASGSPTNIYTQARSDVFGSGVSWESPQLFRLGTSNYIMFAQKSPQGEYKTYYAMATHPFGPWSTPQPINEDGNAPSRMDIYPLNASEAREVQNLIVSNRIASMPYRRTYVLYTGPAMGSNTAFGPYLDFGGSSAARLTVDVIAVGGDSQSAKGAQAAHFKYECALYQEKDGPMFPISFRNYDVQRPNAGWNATLNFSTSATGANGAHGWKVGRVSVTSTDVTNCAWRVTEEMQVQVNPNLGDTPFGDNVSTGGPFGETGGNYAIRELSPYPQTWSATTGNISVPASTTIYIPLNNGASNCIAFTSDASAGTRSLMTSPGTATNMYVIASANPGTSKCTITLMKNGSATALTCGPSAATTANDTTHGVSYVAGDELGWQIAIASGATAVKYAIGTETR